MTSSGGDKSFNGKLYSSVGSNGFFKASGQIDGTADKVITNYHIQIMEGTVIVTIQLSEVSC